VLVADLVADLAVMIASWVALRVEVMWASRFFLKATSKVAAYKAWATADPDSALPKMPGYAGCDLYMKQAGRPSERFSWPHRRRNNAAQCCHDCAVK